MPRAFNKPIVCPTIIGRMTDITVLHAFVEQASGGQGQVVLVSGEAGIGKSRLVGEVKAYAHSLNFLTFQGNCFQMDSSYPYAPLLDLLRSSVEPTSYKADLDPIMLEFARLLPDFALLLTDAHAGFLSDAEQRKRQLFAALTSFFKQRASQQPVLLIIEDLHWCDDISLEFFLSLARLCTTYPLLLLLTYRSDEIQASLQHFLSQLDRLRMSQELQLLPLSQRGVEEMLASLFSLQENEWTHLSDLIYPLTGGNPFFVEEVLTSLIARDDLSFDDGAWHYKTHLEQRVDSIPVPRSVQDAVQHRTRQLTAEARRVVAFAAVAGRRFDFAVLQQVMHCDEDELLPLLKELVFIQLVIEVSAEQFAFRHALTQQAIYAELLVRERRSMHRTLAEVIERLYASTLMIDAHLEDLAYHYYEAEVWTKALEYTKRVGEKASALYAPRAAVDHFTHALVALRHLPEEHGASVYYLRGQAYETLGDFEHALSDYTKLLENAHDRQQHVTEWQGMMALGFLWTGRDYNQAGVWFRRASDLAEELDDATLHARSLNRLGNWLVNTGQIQEGIEAHRTALHLFETQENIQGMAETLDLLAVSYGFYGDSVNGIRTGERASELFRRLGDYRGLLSCLASRSLDSVAEKIITTYSPLKSREACMRDIQEALQLAFRTNSQSGLAFVEFVMTQVLLSFGEFGAAFAHVQEALRVSTAIEHQQWLTASYGVLGQLYLILLDPAQAITALNTGMTWAQTLGSVFWHGYLASFLAQAYVLQHDFANAEAILTSIMPREQQPKNAGERHVSYSWGELALAQGKPDVALTIVEHLLVSIPGNVEPQPVPHLLSLKGRTLLELRRLEEAAQVLEEAKRGAEQRQAPSILWRIHRSLGRVYHLLKRYEHSQREYMLARDIISKLAETIEQASVRIHFEQTALSTLTPEKAPRKTATEQYDGLTAREIEVLRCVARGLTDAQVAEQLIISHRTVHSHLNSIYSKLGITSRSAATRYAIEHHLA